ncbi:MAG: hypothetical protein QM589_02365 [Thermomicrobiales bacterium]
MIAFAPLASLGTLMTAKAGPEHVEERESGRAQSGQGYRVFATRESLVGESTSNGHIITPYDYFVSLPSCTSTSCPGSSPGRAGFTNCGSMCYVKMTNPATGACRPEPVIEVGPWFTVDDWWNPADIRFLNKLPSNRQVLPQGLPGAQAAWDGKNVGYGWGSNGIGGSDYYSSVGNQAGIDLADGTYWSLGIGGGGNWVDVEMLWQTGESPASAAASCGHRLGRGGGAIPKWTPTPVTPTPTVPLISWGMAKVAGTGGSSLNCRNRPERIRNRHRRIFRGSDGHLTRASGERLVSGNLRRAGGICLGKQATSRPRRRQLQLRRHGQPRQPPPSRYRQQQARRPELRR